MKSKYSSAIKPSVLSAFKNLLPALLLMMTLQISAQVKSLKGTVTDAATGKGISAAQISIPDKNKSAIADENGVFTLDDVTATDVLEVSAYGYNLKVIPVKGRQILEVKLFSQAFSNFYTDLNLPLGLAGHNSVTQSAKTLGDIKNTSALTADDIINGEMSGDVRGVSRSGLSGMGSSLFIRGINSLNANAQPLFVVDGVIWDNFQEYGSIHTGYFNNPLDNIDVSDIENITVIKDGNSIYGSKGANGVILIKTKRSRSMVTKISVNAVTGSTDAPGALPMMDTEQFRIYASDLLPGSGFTGTDISSVPFLETNRSSGIYNAYHNNTNWNNTIYQRATTQNYLINAQGGDDKAMYYFSVGYTGSQGVVKTTNLEKLSARFNADFNLFDKLTMALNIGFARNERKLLDDGMDQYSSPTWLAAVKSPFLSPYAFTNTGDITANYANTDVFNIGNPTALIKSSINFLKKYRFNLSFKPKYQITPDLAISSQFDYSLYKTVEGHFIPMDFTTPRLIENKGISYDKISSQVIRNSNIFNESQLTYHKKFNKAHTINAVAGFRYITNYYESDFVEEHNSGSNNNTTITGSYDFLRAEGINNSTNSISNYLTVDYNFENRYFVNATTSMDASSRFGKQTLGGFQMLGVSWGLFPSIGGAWVVSNEKFMANVEPISLLKVRAGYGITGNDGIADYQTNTFFSPIRLVDRANGLIIGNLANNRVQWETNAKVNGGIDLGLFEDVLTINADVYRSNISNMLVLRDLPVFSGLGKYWDNGGSMTNTGFEISANLKLINTRNFQWELGASAGHYQNKILSLADGDYSTSVFDGEVRTAVGESFGAFYGYKTNGVFATQADADAAGLTQVLADGSIARFNAGDVIFVDKNNDKVINAEDKQIIGNPNPKLYGNFNTKMTLGRFTLAALFTYSYGNSIYNYYRSQLEAGKNFNNQTEAMMRRWTLDGQVTNVPKAVYGDPLGNGRFSDRWIEDGSYIKFKNIKLSYDLPLKSDYIEGLNLWVSADNLFTWTKYLGLDPEVSVSNSQYYQGIDAGLLPLTRAYYVGLKVNL